METCSTKHLISTGHALFPAKQFAKPRRIGARTRPLYSKEWDLQDFQSYVTPKELFPASGARIYRPSSLEQIADLFKVQECECLYKVKLKTSGVYGSSLTDPNSGVLICLIDENNYSILQRIPACIEKPHSFQPVDEQSSESLVFQQGSIDEFLFEGQTLGKIAAVWIGLESGRWRFENLSLTVFYEQPLPSVEAGEESTKLTGFKYDFNNGDMLLGEGSDMSMLELRPCLVTDFSNTGVHWQDVKPSDPSPLVIDFISNDQSMKEYADLKLSLLLYDASLILTGLSVAFISIGEKAALAFLTGGIAGFLYLLLLQRSIDGLPAPELPSVRADGSESSDQIVGKFKGPLLTLASAIVFAAIAAKYISGENAVVLTPNDLILGMAGFLMCKVSVLLAAFKPMKTKFRNDN